MALETLKGVREINGKGIIRIEDRPLLKTGEIDWDGYDKLREERPIAIDDDNDMISFKMLTKPAADGGDLRLCQLTDLIQTALIMLKYLNKDYPCRENAITITKLEEALMWQEARTKDRTSREVEGQYKK